jgi:hypothetical protein
MFALSLHHVLHINKCSDFPRLFLSFPPNFPPEKLLGQKLKFNAAIIAAKIIPIVIKN